MSVVKLRVDGLGMGVVEVDGKDLSGALRGEQIHIAVGDPTKVILELALVDCLQLELTDAQIAYDVGAPVRRLLEALEADTDIAFDPHGHSPEILAAYRALRSLLP